MSLKKTQLTGNTFAGLENHHHFEEVVRYRLHSEHANQQLLKLEISKGNFELSNFKTVIHTQCFAQCKNAWAN